MCIIQTSEKHIERAHACASLTLCTRVSLNSKKKSLRIPWNKPPGSYFAKKSFWAGVYLRGAYRNVGGYLAAPKNIIRVNFLPLFEAGQYA